MTEPRRVVVIGAGLAGGRTCVALREAGFGGKIVLIGAEEHLPYDRPPLSKSVLVSGGDTGLGYDFDGLAVTVRLSESARDLDLARRLVTTDRGDIRYDVLVAASGARPIRLPGEGRQIYLRTREDAEQLRNGLQPGARVVVIGGGWIGAEVATAALARGCTVTCLEGAEVPLAVQLGPEVAARLLPWWAGVDLRCGVHVREVTRDGVCLVDGTMVPADLVVTGVGVRAVTEWLAGSGLELDHGVAVDCDRRTSDNHVYAVGDVAARWSPRYSARVVGGHWDEAVNGPTAVAASIVGAPKGADDVPYFWSDQFGRKIQYVGQHGPEDRLVLREHDDPAKWGAAWVGADGELRAHLSVGAPRAMVNARQVIEEGRRMDMTSIGSLTALL